MRKKSLKKNYLFNLAYQILVLVTPLITTPYLSRVLGADGIGTVSYAESIVSYFVLFATLGLTTYGQREISYHQDDIDMRSIIFWETKSLEVITSSLALLIFVIFAMFQQNRYLYLFLSMNILAVTADVTWFFQGMEEFGRIVLRNAVFKLVNIVYIFIFVKTKDDLVRYVFGLSFFLLASNISLWFYLKNYVRRPVWSAIRPFRNIKTVVSLFIPTIAIQVYTVLDKTMIGIITADAFENGYYEQAIKISKLVLTIVTALGTVMIPRIGYYFGKGEREAVNHFIYKAYNFSWLLGIPLCFGLIGTASNFVPWFYGVGFSNVVPLLSILAFLIIAIGINNVTGMQYLIPTKRQNLFTMTVLIGAGVNFLLNIVLIRLYGSLGAAIASVLAESIIALVQIYLVRNELSPFKIFSLSKNYFISGMVMLLVLKYISSVFSPSLIHTVEMTLAGAFIYFLMLLIIRDEFFFELLNTAYKRVKEKLGKTNTK